MAEPQRFRVPLLRDHVFVRRPVADLPKDGTVCFVDDGDDRGWHNGQSVGLYRNGVWTNGKGRPLPFVPTHWTMIEKTTDEV